MTLRDALEIVSTGDVCRFGEVDGLWEATRPLQLCRYTPDGSRVELTIDGESLLEAMGVQDTLAQVTRERDRLAEQLVRSVPRRCPGGVRDSSIPGRGCSKAVAVCDVVDEAGLVLCWLAFAKGAAALAATKKGAGDDEH